MDVKIIPLTPNRLAEYRTLRIEAFTVDSLAFGMMTPELDSKISDEEILGQTSENDLGKILLAEVDHQIVGTIRIERDLNKRSGAILRLFFVSPHVRKNKIGLNLLKDAINHTKKHAMVYVKLYVRETQIEAIKIYEWFGFTKIEDIAVKRKLKGEHLKFHTMRLWV